MRVAALVNGGRLNVLAGATIARLLIKLPTLTDEFVQQLLDAAAVARSDSELLPSDVCFKHELPGISALLEHGIREAQTAHVLARLKQPGVRVYK
jgi:hypothetical protein